MRGATETFKILESRLSEECHTAYHEAVALSQNVLDAKTAIPEQCWIGLWDKPLYANSRVATAERWVRRLSPHMPGAWRSVGVDAGLFLITQTRPGLTNDSFDVQGSIPMNSGIASRRLYAIQGAAKALRTRCQNSSYPYSEIYDTPLIDLIPALRSEMGFGWGNITTMHFLTDMGRAVKPDVHLVKAVKSLSGMFTEITARPSTLAQSVRISDWVSCLTEAIYGDTLAQHLRYVDKVLMEFSRHNLLSD